MNRSLSLAALGFVGSLPAQVHVYVPSGAEMADQSSQVAVAGFNTAARQQVIIDASLLTSILGHEIIAVSFRRDANWEKALDSGSVDLDVVVSHTSTQPKNASPVFDDNLDPVPANRVLVFSGTATLPASPDASSRTVSWSNSQDIVTIQFSNPFTYSGGNLCVDLIGAPTLGSESTFWGPDGVIEDNHGVVNRVGHSCHPFGLARVAQKSLVPGTTSRFRALGAPGALGVLFVGVPAPAFDLSTLGLSVTNCELYVAPFVSIPTTFVPASLPIASGPIGYASVNVQFAATPGSLGFSFRAQFASATTTIETTEALDCTLASSLPQLLVSSVYASQDGGVPATGTVFSNRAPVIRFTAQLP